MTEEQALAHRQTWELIPWIVNGTAAADDRQRVEAHLRGCADCRDEFALQSQLHAGLNVESAAFRDPHPALRRLLARIDDSAEESSNDSVILPGDSPRTAARSGETPRLTTRWMQALVAAVVVQAIGLSLLGALLLGRDPIGSAAPTAGYETLSRTESTVAATIRFVPATTLTIQAMQTLLADVKLRIVESSDDNAIFGLAPTQISNRGGSEAVNPAASDTSVVIARLRAHPGVLLAEPVIAPAEVH